MNWEGDLSYTLFRFENVKHLAKIPQRYPNFLKGVLKSVILLSLTYIFIHTHSRDKLNIYFYYLLFLNIYLRNFHSLANILPSGAKIETVFCIIYEQDMAMTIKCHYNAEYRQVYCSRNSKSPSKRMCHSTSYLKFHQYVDNALRMYM